MYIRAIALALPLVMGIAACKTSSTTRGETASTSQPRSDQDRATASSGTHAGTDTSATASGTAGTEGSATSPGTPGIGGEATAGGTMQGGAHGTGAHTGATASGTMSGTATADDDLKGHESDELVSGKLTKVSDRSIEIESAQGEQKTLQVVPETLVTIDGRDAQASELQEGQEIRASFNTVEGRDVAVQIKAGQDTGMGTMQGGSPGTMDPGSTGTMDPGSTGTTDPGSTGTMDPGSTGTTDPGTSGTTSDPIVK
jgi:hypothetical protein